MLEIYLSVHRWVDSGETENKLEGSKVILVPVEGWCFIAASLKRRGTTGDFADRFARLDTNRTGCKCSITSSECLKCQQRADKSSAELPGSASPLTSSMVPLRLFRLMHEAVIPQIVYSAPCLCHDVRLNLSQTKTNSFFHFLPFSFCILALTVHFRTTCSALITGSSSGGKWFSLFYFYVFLRLLSHVCAPFFPFSTSAVKTLHSWPCGLASLLAPSWSGLETALIITKTSVAPTLTPLKRRGSHLITL